MTKANLFSIIILSKFVNERRADMMNTFMSVDDVAKELGISKSYAYKIVHRLNAELKEKGYMTISGRINRNYFMEKLCYGAVQDEKED